LIHFYKRNASIRDEYGIIAEILITMSS